MNNFESRFAMGEDVAINFGYAGNFGACKVTGVHFTLSKVRYDIEIETSAPEKPTHKTRLYNIDSDFVMSRTEWLEYNQSLPDYGSGCYQRVMPLKN